MDEKAPKVVDEAKGDDVKEDVYTQRITVYVVRYILNLNRFSIYTAFRNLCSLE